MNELKKVKIGLIGLGYIGRYHADYMKNMANIDIVGAYDILKERTDEFSADYKTKAYYSHTGLLEESGADAVLISTPHYDHTPICIDAFERGVHVLCEKPLAVHVNDAKKAIDAYEKARVENPDIVFGIMFMERAYACYKKLKDIIDSGELGRLTRATWINTAWFRSQAYYDSAGWRATWAGEGGGILTNQCPHNLDIYQWLFGVPSRVSGHANLGKYHDIEVEDEVTAYFEHENSMIGHLITTTAEAPGTNRLEIVGENGKLVYENEKLVFYRNRISMLKLLKETKESFADIESWYTEVPIGRNPLNPHEELTKAFIDRIINRRGSLVADGTDGINSVAIANAIMLSSFEGKKVEIPLDGDEFENRLKELIKNSKSGKAKEE